MFWVLKRTIATSSKTCVNIYTDLGFFDSKMQIDIHVYPKLYFMKLYVSRTLCLFTIFENLSLQNMYISKNSFSYFSIKKYVVGTQKNRLNETVLLNTSSKCFNL